MDGEEDITLFSTKPPQRKKARISQSETSQDIQKHAVKAEGRAKANELDERASFRDLGLSEWLSRVCDSLGMRQPTEVQRGTIPAVLAGRDVIGVAHTGSGKTAAFALPILQRLTRNPYGVFALVLTPTRWVIAVGTFACTAACSTHGSCPRPLAFHSQICLLFAALQLPAVSWPFSLQISLEHWVQALISRTPWLWVAWICRFVASGAVAHVPMT